MPRYLTFVGVPVIVEADNDYEASRLARENMFADIGEYEIHEFGVEIVEELEDDDE